MAEQVQEIYSMCSTLNREWVVSLRGNSRTLSIKMPIVDIYYTEINKQKTFTSESGSIVFSPMILPIRNVPYGCWQLITKSRPEGGRSLCVTIDRKIPNTPGPIYFGYYARQVIKGDIKAKLSGSELQAWVGRVNRFLKRSMGEKPLFAPN